MRQRHVTHHHTPPTWIGVLVALLFVILMAAARLGFMRYATLPIAYGVPVVVIAYFRNKPLLWSACAAFAAISLARFLGGGRVVADGAQSPWRISDLVMVELDLLVVTMMGHVWISLQASADARNAELAVRRREAEAANLRKTRFLAAVSHDLRTPANAISLLADLLQRTAADPARAGEIGELSQEMHASAAALVTLLNDVLDIARFDAGGMQVQLSEFSLNEMMEQERGRLAPLAREKNLAYQWSLPQSPIWLRADRIKLSRVIGNLVGNAAKFTDHGEVRVEAARNPQGGVDLRVIDTGIGIAPEHQRQIFDEFLQLHNPERDRARGSGLGLSICRRLTDVMGASLAVQSAPGRGSTFTVTLPAQSVIEPPPQASGGQGRA